jgi:alkylation response protein AidB-like acyl-CoA dehydrogenase
MIKENCLQAFVVTEPATGANATRLITVTRRKCDWFLTRSRKTWTSRAEGYQVGPASTNLVSPYMAAHTLRLARFF